jgi:hypothetical protein
MAAAATIVLALPIFLVAGCPVSGWALAAVLWAAGQGLGEGRWYSVGRLNYSMIDHQLVNTVFGLEYDAGCWIGRIVLEKLQTSALTTNTSIQFQLEFVVFSRLGSSPLQALKTNIPYYQFLREQVSTPAASATITDAHRWPASAPT